MNIILDKEPFIINEVYYGVVTDRKKYHYELCRSFNYETATEKILIRWKDGLAYRKYEHDIIKQFKEEHKELSTL